MLELFYRSLVTFTFTFLPHTHLLKELKKKKKKMRETPLNWQTKIVQSSHNHYHTRIHSLTL